MFIKLEQSSPPVVNTDMEAHEVQESLVQSYHEFQVLYRYDYLDMQLFSISGYGRFGKLFKNRSLSGRKG